MASKIEAMGDLSAPDWDAARAAEERMFRAAIVLRDGRIASPKALCLALGARRYTYEDVCKRYSRGRAGTARPRRGTITEKMLVPLEQSGDERFVRSAT